MCTFFLNHRPFTLVVWLVGAREPAMPADTHGPAGLDAEDARKGQRPDAKF